MVDGHLYPEAGPHLHIRQLDTLTNEQSDFGLYISSALIGP
jgi:hypothetical protein